MGSGKEQDMASEWMVRGVPVRIAEDAWWLDDGGKPENPEAETRLPRWTGLACLALATLSDVLFWGHAPGLSPALFAGASMGVAMLLFLSGKRMYPGLTMTLAVRPVVEPLQLLSLVFHGAGLLISLVWVTVGTDRIVRRAFWF